MLCSDHLPQYISLVNKTEWKLCNIYWRRMLILSAKLRFEVLRQHYDLMTIIRISLGWINTLTHSLSIWSFRDCTISCWPTSKYDHFNKCMKLIPFSLWSFHLIVEIAIFAGWRSTFAHCLYLWSFRSNEILTISWCKHVRSS